MNTKRILISLVTGAMFTGSLAIAASGNDQPRAQSRVRVAKPTTTTTTRVSGNTGSMRTRQRFASNQNATAFRTRNRVVTSTGNPGGVRTSNRVVTRTFPSRTYSYRTYSYGGYPYYSSYGYGYPYYGLGVNFGAPYYGYYPYGYGGYPYDYYGSYPYNSSYGYYSYSQPAYGNGSIVVTIQSRLARAGYYHGPIDGVMGPATSYAIRGYERNHGMRMDGAISGPLLRSMGLRS